MKEIQKIEGNPKILATQYRLMTPTPGPTGARCAQPCLSQRRQVDCFRRKSRTNQEEIKNLQEEIKKNQEEIQKYWLMTATPTGG